MGDDQMEKDVQMDEKIEEEYKIWKKHTPYLYDTLMTNALEWPSLTVEWLSKKIAIEGKDYTEQQLLLGTHTNGDEQNYLMIANVKLPNQNVAISDRHYDEAKGELGTYGGAEAKFSVTVKINHDGEVNRARLMPQDEFFVATKTVLNSVYLFDISKHSSTPGSDGICQPLMKLEGHEGEGYGIDWNRVNKGKLISCADDSKVCVYDVNATKPDSNGRLFPEWSIDNAHEGNIGEVAFSTFDGSFFGTVGEDKFLRFWDLREESKKPLYEVANAHQEDINSLSFSPMNENLILTAGGDNVVKLWDIRNLKFSLHTFEGHENNILQVLWSPDEASVFASCGEDRRVIIWDAARIGEEQSTIDEADGPPELLFKHAGHTSKVSDFGWNKNDPLTIASVAEDNVLHIWSPQESMFKSESLADQAKKLNRSEIP